MATIRPERRARGFKPKIEDLRKNTRTKFFLNKEAERTQLSRNASENTTNTSDCKILIADMVSADSWAWWVLSSRNEAGGKFVLESQSVAIFSVQELEQVVCCVVHVNCRSSS